MRHNPPTLQTARAWILALLIAMALAGCDGDDSKPDSKATLANASAHKLSPLTNRPDVPKTTPLAGTVLSAPSGRVERPTEGKVGVALSLICGDNDARRELGQNAKLSFLGAPDTWRFDSTALSQGPRVELTAWVRKKSDSSQLPGSDAMLLGYTTRAPISTSMRQRSPVTSVVEAGPARNDADIAGLLAKSITVLLQAAAQSSSSDELNIYAAIVSCNPAGDHSRATDVPSAPDRIRFFGTQLVDQLKQLDTTAIRGKDQLAVRLLAASDGIKVAFNDPAATYTDPSFGARKLVATARELSAAHDANALSAAGAKLLSDLSNGLEEAALPVAEQAGWRPFHVTKDFGGSAARLLAGTVSFATLTSQLTSDYAHAAPELAARLTRAALYQEVVLAAQDWLSPDDTCLSTDKPLVYEVFSSLMIPLAYVSGVGPQVNATGTPTTMLSTTPEPAMVSYEMSKVMEFDPRRGDEKMLAGTFPLTLLVGPNGERNYRFTSGIGLLTNPLSDLALKVVSGTPMAPNAVDDDSFPLPLSKFAPTQFIGGMKVRALEESLGDPAQPNDCSGAAGVFCRLESSTHERSL